MIRASLAKLVRCVAVLAVAVSVVLTAAPAQAQMGMGMEGMSPTITRRSIDTYTKILGLDKEQKEAALNLYEGYKKDFEGAREKVRADMAAAQEKMADTADMRGMQREMMKNVKSFMEKSEALENAFVSDLKVVLTEKQLANWPKVERSRRREKHMRQPFVSGANVDMVRVVERVKATPLDKDELASMLDRYEVDMDKHTQAMAIIEKEMAEKSFDPDADMMDMNRWVTIVKAPYETAKGMRETNKEYARKLAPLLDDASRKRFEDEFKMRAYPRVYKPMHVLKMMDEAEKLPGLDAAKKAEIGTIRANLLRDAVGVNERWAKALEEREDKGGGTMAVFMASMQKDVSELNKPVNEARLARKTLEADAKKKLEDLLTEEQRAKLPAAPRENNNPWADFQPPSDDDEPGQ